MRNCWKKLSGIEEVREGIYSVSGGDGGLRGRGSGRLGGVWMVEGGTVKVLGEEGELWVKELGDGAESRGGGISELMKGLEEVG